MGGGLSRNRKLIVIGGGRNRIVVTIGGIHNMLMYFFQKKPTRHENNSAFMHFLFWVTQSHPLNSTRHLCGHTNNVTEVLFIYIVQIWLIPDGDEYLVDNVDKYFNY